MLLVRTTFSILALTVIASGLARAEDAKPPASVVVCDDLVSLRRLMAEVPDSANAARKLAEHPACRTVEQAQVGEVEHRSMVGGLPYECRTVAGRACVWVLP